MISRTFTLPIGDGFNPDQFADFVASIRRQFHRDANRLTGSGDWVTITIGPDNTLVARYEVTRSEDPEA